MKDEKKETGFSSFMALLYLLTLIGLVIIIFRTYFRWYYGDIQPTIIELLTIYLLMKIHKLT